MKLTDEEFRQISSYIKQHYGIHLTNEIYDYFKAFSSIYLIKLHKIAARIFYL